MARLNTTHIQTHSPIQTRSLFDSIDTRRYQKQYDRVGAGVRHHSYLLLPQLVPLYSCTHARTRTLATPTPTPTPTPAPTPTPTPTPTPPSPGTPAGALRNLYYSARRAARRTLQILLPPTCPLPPPPNTGISTYGLPSLRPGTPAAALRNLYSLAYLRYT